MKKIKIIIVGLGKQACEDHLPSIENNKNYTLVGVVDKNINTVKSVSTKYSVSGFIDINEAIKKCNPDAALLALPHNEYFNVLKILCMNGIHILKEKPFAINLDEARKIDKMAIKNNILINVTLQRRFNPIFQNAKNLLDKIGKIFLIQGKYVLNIDRLDEGWRSSKEKSGGGALLDMGYHYIDLLLWYLGMPSSIFVQLSTGNRINQNYDVEDTAIFNFSYSGKKYNQKSVGNILISRVGDKKEEYLEFFGTEGKVVIKKNEVRLFNEIGELIELDEFKGTKKNIMTDMFNHFAHSVVKYEKNNNDVNSHMEHAILIEAGYKSDAACRSVNPSEMTTTNKELKDIEECLKALSDPSVSNYSIRNRDKNLNIEECS